MRKRSKRIIREQSEPAMIRTLNNLEVETAQLLAISALQQGFATYENSYRVLADCHGILAIALQTKTNNEMDAVKQISYLAILNIYDRMKKTGKYGATGDEIKALQILVSTSKDFWSRQSASFLEDCVNKLRAVREIQIRSLKERTKN